MIPRELDDRDPKLDMTPMIDCTFLLLVFFMCTIRFKSLEGKLQAYLPKDAGPGPAASAITPAEIELVVVAEGTKRDPRDASLAWSGTGRFQYTDRAVAYRIGPQRFDSLGAVRVRLEELRETNPEQAVTLRAGQGVVTGEVVAVLDELIGAGFEGVRFAAHRDVEVPSRARR